MRKFRISRILHAAIARISLRSKYYCVVCEHSPGAFLPYRDSKKNSPPLMKALATIGSDIVRFECPWCGSHDRERHLLLYTRAASILPDLSGKHVLHFAPERNFSRFIANAGPAQYVKADLYPISPDIKRIDMLDIPFADSTFDLVIANHVLEHVADDKRALAEIQRIIKLGGYAILQTPFSSRLCNTWSDPGIDSDVARLQAYGQEDHVRLYGKDIFERFAASGLEPQIGSHAELLPGIDPERFGVNGLEPFFLFRKSLAQSKICDLKVAV